MLFALLILTLPFAFSACSVQQINAVQSGMAKIETLSVLCFESGVKSRLSVAVDYYLKDNRAIKISLDSVEDEDKLLTRLQSVLSGDDRPVLFNIRGTSDMLELKDYLYDFSADALAKRVKYNLLDNVTDSDGVYGIPIGIEGCGILYNKEIFDDAGINTDGITDITSLTYAVKKLDKLIASGKLSEKYPDLQRVFCPWDESNITNLLPLLLNASGYYENERALQNSSSLSIYESDSLQKLISLNKKYAHTDVNGGYKSGACQMANECAAVYITSSRVINDIKEEKTESADKLAFLGFPGGKLCVGTPAYWAINKNASSAQISAALDFLKWLYTSDTGKTITLDSMYLVPAYSGYEKLAQNQAINVSVSEFINSDKTYAYITPGLPSEMDNKYFSQILLSFANGNISFKKALSQIKNDFAKLQKSGG